MRVNWTDPVEVALFIGWALFVGFLVMSYTSALILGVVALVRNPRKAFSDLTRLLFR